MTDYIPIECSEYDWLELACMDACQVELDLGSRTVIGVAEDLCSRNGEEYLRILPSNGAAEHVRVDHIRSITVLSRPARFTYHAFSVSAE